MTSEAVGWLSAAWLGALLLAPVPSLWGQEAAGAAGTGAARGVAEAFGRLRSCHLVIRIERARPGARSWREEGEDEREPERQEPSLVSGLVLDRDGLAATTARALRDAVLVVAETADGEIVRCEVLGYDPDSGVGAIRLDPPVGTPLRRASKPPEPGERVVAVGDPFGLGPSLAVGWVSAVDRTVETDDATWRGLIQVTLDVNPGDQGGPVGDAEGRVLGMLLTRYRPEEDGERGVEAHGVGFVVPIERVAGIARRLDALSRERKQKRRTDRPWLGVRVRDIDDATLRLQLRLDEDGGLLVERVFAGSPAARAGLAAHDVLVRFAGGPVGDLQHFARLLRSRRTGEEVEVVVLRRGEPLRLKVVLGAR